MTSLASTEHASSDGLLAKVQALTGLLAEIAAAHTPAVLASSLSNEDMVLTDAVLRARIDIDIFTLDTGRLHADTLALIATVRERYGYAIAVYRPDPQAVFGYVSAFGRDAFYTSTDLRKRCCEIRKVEPLKRALAGKRAWLTGMRREQSISRSAVEIRTHDAVHSIEKFSPLADWTEADVWSYIRAFSVPYNRLYDQGYRSIGCAPCTRPVTPTEDVRAGRWWWEQPENRECGLHLGPDGKLVRAKAMQS
jgi:phosphoadenosine phosphosulfate reductase